MEVESASVVWHRKLTIVPLARSVGIAYSDCVQKRPRVLTHDLDSHRLFQIGLAEQLSQAKGEECRRGEVDKLFLRLESQDQSISCFD